MNWSLYAMERIVIKEEERAASNKELNEKLLKLRINAFGCNDVERRQLLDQQIKELSSQLEVDCQDFDARYRMSNTTLTRCLLVLSICCKLENGTNRVLASGGISIASIFLDMPVKTDIAHSAIGTISNTLNTYRPNMVGPQTFLTQCILSRAYLR
jgi:hypothetical protein